MLPTIRTFAVIASVALVALFALACHQPAARNSARGPDCKVDVLPHPPGDDYVEVGELFLEAQAADLSQPKFKNPHELAAALHDQICAVGADTLVTERNAAGEIVRGAVYRHATMEDLKPPAAPPKAETCEPACRPGFTCEGGTCVQNDAPPPAATTPPATPI
jgi:hypothetical protein